MNEDNERQSAATNMFTLRSNGLTQEQNIKRFLAFTNRLRMGLTNDYVHRSSSAIDAANKRSHHSADVEDSLRQT